MRKVIDYAFLIQFEHWGKGLSLREIERLYGLGNGVVSRAAIKHSIRTRTRAEQQRVSIDRGITTYHSGADHHFFGLRKENSDVMAAHSARMTANNPTQNGDVVERIKATNLANGHFERVSERMKNRHVSHEYREKIAKTLQPQFREKISDREQMMLLALSHDDRWVHQHLFEHYLLDFAIPSLGVAIEIDVGGHKLGRSQKRDESLAESGWVILRMRCDKATSVDYWHHLFSMMEKFVPNFESSCKFPPFKRQYRVIVRYQKNPTGIILDLNDRETISSLSDLLHDRLKAPFMG
ncbi:DUF559 domain-containing protein [Kluyvera sichuanensis]|uniref:DUF559 domain-containing protein n=1 Tax=Kluyvera sichuanensis TaxID=2725494 RepID=UPI000C206859